MTATGMPWIEINFASDIERANAVILPRILPAAGNRRAAINVSNGSELTCLKTLI